VYAYHQPGTGPTRTGPTSMGRFQPYGTSHAQQNGRRNAWSGPPTLMPPPIPYVSHPTQQPSGGIISETTADAERTQTITEEDKVPVSNFYRSHIPRVIEWSFGVRHPSGPGSPAAKDDPAHAACRFEKIPLSYTTGHGERRDSQKVQPSIWL
jgi:hypothetical protein